MGQDITAQSFNVGTEWDLAIVAGGLVLAEFGLVESIGRKMNMTLLQVTPVNNNGKRVSRTTVEDFTFTYAITRQNDMVDDLADLIKNLYRSRGKGLVFAGTETVINAGVPSQWSYTDGTMLIDGLGDFKNADRVDGVGLTIHWGDRQKILGGSLVAGVSSSFGL
jgi:hypothetical protein